MFRSLVAIASIAVTVGACALVDPVDSRSDTIGRSLTKARNEAIFLNLIRASQNYPLDFVTIANVTPSLSNTSSLTLPSFLVGPGLPNGNVLFGPARDVVFGDSASTSTAISTNFNLSTQETSNFYDGFLKPVDLQVVNYFVRQNYSRELLFWLFIDSIEVDIRGRPSIGSRYDPPRDYGCNRRTVDPEERCFADFVQIAIGEGLTVEETTVQNGGKPTIYNRLCFNPILARDAQYEMNGTGRSWSELHARFSDMENYPFKPLCGGRDWNPVADANKRQPDFFPFQVGNIRFKILPRSAYGVFKFLGEMIKVQLENPEPKVVPFIPLGRETELEQLPVLLTGENDPNLITVVRNGGGCFVHTWFENTDYCVPVGADTTKSIFSLLAQLIAIQTSASDLSITPLVRVIQ